MLNTVATQSKLAMDKEGVDIGPVVGIVFFSIVVIVGIIVVIFLYER